MLRRLVLLVPIAAITGGMRGTHHAARGFANGQALGARGEIEWIAVAR